MRCLSSDFTLRRVFYVCVCVCCGMVKISFLITFSPLPSASPLLDWHQLMCKCSAPFCGILDYFISVDVLSSTFLASHLNEYIFQLRLIIMKLVAISFKCKKYPWWIRYLNNRFPLWKFHLNPKWTVFFIRVL